MREKHFIDSHKGVTGLFILLLIAWQGAWQNNTAMIYLALHGSYGLMWILKSQLFPDASWEKPCSIWWGLAIWLGLSLYWVAPWIIVTGNVSVPGGLLLLAVGLFALGVFLHFAADMQKHMWLALRPGELLCTGLWARLRNPNYFGELLIYLSFAVLSMHWLPYLILGVFVLTYWIPNMLRKDKSLARYPDFQAYRRRSRLFLPLLF